MIQCSSHMLLVGQPVVAARRAVRRAERAPRQLPPPGPPLSVRGFVCRSSPEHDVSIEAQPVVDVTVLRAGHGAAGRSASLATSLAMQAGRLRAAAGPAAARRGCRQRIASQSRRWRRCREAERHRRPQEAPAGSSSRQRGRSAARLDNVVHHLRQAGRLKTQQAAQWEKGTA